MKTKKMLLIAVAIIGVLSVLSVGITALIANAAVDPNTALIEAKVLPGGYPEIVVEAGKPVRINFKVDANDLNGCNNEIVIPEWNIDKKLSPGDNFVDLTPEKTGEFQYTCWMGMLQSKIIVAEPGSRESGALPQDGSANAQTGCPMQSGNGGSGGCGMMQGGNGSAYGGGSGGCH